jgi:Putative zinc ribbon domain
MYSDTSRGPFCQSCGMPMRRPSDFGVDADGRRINDYCHFCFDNGMFTEPAMTPQEMIDRCVTFTVRQTFTPEMEARALLTDVIPRLKRWREAMPGV